MDYNIFTSEEMQDIYTQNGIRHYDIHDQYIQWQKEDKDGMVHAQMKINNLILTQSLQKEELKTLKEALRVLTDDLTNFYTITCDVCNKKQSTLAPMGVEAISMKTFGVIILYLILKHIS